MAVRISGLFCFQENHGVAPVRAAASSRTSFTPQWRTANSATIPKTASAAKTTATSWKIREKAWSMA
jgi:hypothetical protein